MNSTLLRFLLPWILFLMSGLRRFRLKLRPDLEEADPRLEFDDALEESESESDEADSPLCLPNSL